MIAVATLAAASADRAELLGICFGIVVGAPLLILRDAPRAVRLSVGVATVVGCAVAAVVLLPSFGRISACWDSQGRVQTLFLLAWACWRIRRGRGGAVPVRR